MPTTLIGSVAVQIAMALSNPLDLSTPIDKLLQKFQFDLANGTGADQADKLWHDTRSIATATNDDLDLSGGALVDAFGTVFTIARLKAAIVRARSTNTTNITVGNSAAPPQLWFGATTHTEIIKPGQLAFHMAPDATAWPITATTADILRLANAAGATALVDIILIGASA